MATVPTVKTLLPRSDSPERRSSRFIVGSGVEVGGGSRANSNQVDDDPDKWADAQAQHRANLQRKVGHQHSHRCEAAEEPSNGVGPVPVSYTHLRAHETGRNLVCRLL